MGGGGTPNASERWVMLCVGPRRGFVVITTPLESAVPSLLALVVAGAGPAASVVGNSDEDDRAGEGLVVGRIRGDGNVAGPAMTVLSPKDMVLRIPPWLRFWSLVMLAITLDAILDVCLKNPSGGSQRYVCMLPLPLTSTPPVGVQCSEVVWVGRAGSAISKAIVTLETWIWPGIPLLSMREAVFIVSP